MVRRTFRRIAGSLFAKLLLIFFLTFVGIIFLVGGAFHQAVKETRNIPLKENVIQYLQYIIKDLGTAPSLVRARQIAERTSLQIRYEGPGQSWSTSDRIPPPSELHLTTWQTDPPIRGMIEEGTIIVAVSQGTGTFIFVLSPGFHEGKDGALWLAFVIFILFAAGVLMYLAIRHLLKPLQYLAEGVRQIGGGRLDHEVPGSGSLEFIDLAEAFNTMTVRIRSMLHAKEQLLLDVSHELRSPLTRMKVALEMLPEGQMRENMKVDIREMETMVSEILEESRLRHATGGLAVEEIPADFLLKEISDLYQGQAPGLRIDPLPEDARIHGDPVFVKMVLNNVITNAIKYSPADGEPVRLIWKEDDACTIVQVRDRGVGIPAEDLPYVFEPFYRVDKSRSKRTGGYGLGLSLCKTIMEVHRGRIDVESTPGAGTTISLYFPNP